MPLVFSYGSLQQADVQLKTVGRVLDGHQDELPEFELSRSRDGRHANLTFNGRRDSRVAGASLEISDAELVVVDEYERADGYARIAVTLASGRQAWVFVEGDAMLTDLRALSSEDIVERTVEDWTEFKKAGAELEARPPSPEAATRVARAYAEGRVPAFVAAHLLGCIRDECGYATAREILLRVPWRHAAAPAGIALAQIRGEGAFDDLSDVLMSGPNQVSREGAAWGLSDLGVRAVSPIGAAVVDGRIRWQTGGSILANLRIDPAVVAELLASANEREVKLGADVLDSVLPGGTDDAREWLGRARPIVVEPLRRVLTSSSVTMAPRKRRALEAWLFTDA